jgi:hypothetical protein
MGARPLESIPQAEISNGIIKARLYLPDTKNGYYRGSRFDWSGVMPSLEYDGHTYFGQWFERYSPTLHDAIMGPVDDFYPIGYSEAKPGETFLKIGIGMVTKPDEPKYFFANSYPIANAGEWKVKKKSDRVEFFQKLDDKDYAYEYQKTVVLTKDKPQMVIEHVLKNTSAKVLETTVYNHNFFVLDKQPIGSDVEVTFPFNLTSETPGNEAFGKIQDNKIIFHKTLEKNEHLFYGSLQGFGDTTSDYDIRIENHKTGAAVRITCEQPLAKLVFWSAPKTVCPEPYIQLSVNPGETFRWNIVYQFYTSDTN